MSWDSDNAEAQRRRGAEGENISASPRLGDAAFKETEIGPVPVDWEIKPLGKIAEVITGRTPSTKESRYWDKGTIPFITPVDLQGGPIRKAARTVTQEGVEVSRALPQGTVLVSCIGYIGKVGVIDAPTAVTNQQINAVAPKKKYADNWYLAFAMMHLEPILKDRARITTVPILNKSNFQRVPIPLPPLPEQRRIAHTLSAIQQAIAAQEDVIAAAREVKRSLMQRLFTYGPGSQPAPTKETEIGEIPEHWKVTPFGKVATLQRGKDLPKRKRKPGSYPIGGSNGIVGHHEEYVAHGPGVLVGRSGSVGKVTWIESAYWPLNTALWVKNYHGNDPHFIYYLLSYFDFSRYTSGVSVPTLNRNLVHPVKIGIPSIEEQRYVARILSVADAKIAVEEQRKAALEALFHSTLQQLMTGQIRLNAEPQSRGDAEGKP